MEESHKKLRVVFTGYAPVHFVCFRPLYDRLIKHPDVEVCLSGGLQIKHDKGIGYDLEGLYSQFKLENANLMSVDKLRQSTFDILFAANTKMIAPAHVDTRIQIFHGVSFRNKAVRPENMTADYFFITGPYMRQRFKDAGLMEDLDPRALEIGFLKTDALIDGSLNRKNILTEYGFDGMRPVILYAPTGQKYNSMETMGEAVLQELSACDKYDILVKLHDHPKNTDINWAERITLMSNAHLQLVNDLNVIRSLYVADMLITDASSVSSEYSILDRPMIFLHVPKLLARAKQAKNSMLDKDTWGRRGGTIVRKPEDIMQAVTFAFDNPKDKSDIRRAMATDLFYNQGQATDKAFAWFQDKFLTNRNSEMICKKAHNISVKNNKKRISA